MGQYDRGMKTVLRIATGSRRDTMTWCDEREPAPGRAACARSFLIMAIKVVISRRVPAEVAPNLKPLLLKLRTLAGAQPGYVTGETLVNTEDKEDVLVFSTWSSLEHWRAWVEDPRRAEVEDVIDAMLGTPARYKTYFYG